MGPTVQVLYGVSNVDISKQIVVTMSIVLSGISRANQTISIYHGETLIADCTMPSAGLESFPTVVVGELTLHDETFTGFVAGETYTIVAGDEPPITGFVADGCLFSFDVNASWFAATNPNANICAGIDYSASHTNYTISQKITTTKKRYDIKRLPEELLPKTAATKAEVRKAQSTADKAKVKADDAYGYAASAWDNAATAQSTAEAAQSTAEAAQSTAETAQTTAETAMNKIPLNPKNFFGSLYSQNNEIVGWYENLPYIEYFSYSGAFRKNHWEPTGIEIQNLPNTFMCELDDKLIICKSVHISSKMRILGVAFTWNANRNPIYYVSSEAVDGDTSTGINLTFSPYGYFLLASSTPDSTKQFKLTVDDSGVISATEVVE